MIKRYVEFTVWNDMEEREATAEEIQEYVRIKILGNGKCEIITFGNGYSLLCSE